MASSPAHTTSSSGDVRAVTLPSGLRVLLRESHLCPVTEVQIWARVGSADETADQSGIAHFHEHMLFKGTERRGVGEVAADVEACGGYLNAYTSFDMTVYHATLPSESSEAGLDVLADVTQNSVFAEEEIDREIEVVLEEIRRSEDTPHHVLGDAVFSLAYAAHPYRRPILGDPASVRALTSARVRDFYEHWYRPDNLMVVAVGDFSGDAFLASIESAFPGTGGSPRERNRPAEPPHSGWRTTLLRRPFERACLELCWPSAPFEHPDTPLLDLLAFILGEGESSRLVRRLREDAKLADRIDASSYTPLDSGLFGTSADFASENAEALVRGLAFEIEKLRHETVSSQELEKARANFLASEHWERESVSGQARKLGTFELLAGDWAAERNYLESIAGARPEDLLDVAVRWLEPGRAVLAALLPEDQASAIDEGSLTNALADGVAAATRRFRTPTRKASSPTRVAGAPQIESFELPCGASLHVSPRRDLPIFSMRAAMLGGLLAETEETAGATHFLAGMWMRGTRSQGTGEFARAVESLAGDVDGFSGRSSIGFTADGTVDHLDALLDLLCEALLEPAFSDEELERERSDTLAALARREDRLGSRVFDVFCDALYPTHPYRYPLLGTEAAVRGFDSGGQRRLHNALVHGANLDIACVGDVDPDRLAEGLGRRLAELPSDRSTLAIPAEDPLPEAPREVVLHKDRSQAHLFLGFRGLRLSDPERIHLEVLTQILGGQGGRLFLELRDKQSLAYSVAAMSVEGVAPGYFGIYIAAAPEKFDEARSGVFDQLKKLLDAAPSAEELDAAKQHLLGSFVIEQQRAGARAFHMALDARYGLGPESSAETPQRVRAVTRDDLLAVSQRIIDFDRYILAALRP